MKKIIACLSFVIFSTALWAVWEGNAGVGAARDFTSGSMLVRSDMFPRDTFIEIENLENGKKTTALVSGSSGIAGLLVNMSPEVAKVLDVPSDKIVRVRINTTTKLSDDFLAESDYTTSDADYNPSLAVTTAPETPAPAYDESDTVLFDPASLKNYPKSVQPKPSETVAKKESEVEPVPEPVSEPAETEPKTEPEAVAVNNEPEPVTESQPEVKPLNNEKAYLERAGLKPPKSKNDGSAATKTETVTTTTTKTVTTETYTEPVVEKPAETAPVTPQVQPATTKPEAETKPISTVGGVTQPATTKPEAETKPVSTVGGVTQPATTKPEAETKPVSTVGGITQPENTKTEEMAAAAKPVEIAPTKKSSEITKPAAKPVEVKTIETTKTTTAVTVIEEPEQTIAQNSKKTPIIEVPSIGNLNSMKIEPYIVQADSQMYAGSLQKGKYYLQIANYSKEANAQSILAKYKKYPLAIEKLGSGTRTRYRVFIGPLKIDEMGAVMEQFNKFGFTDSFFKVIQ